MSLKHDKDIGASLENLISLGAIIAQA